MSKTVYIITRTFDARPTELVGVFKDELLALEVYKRASASIWDEDNITYNEIDLDEVYYMELS